MATDIKRETLITAQHSARDTWSGTPQWGHQGECRAVRWLVHCLTCAYWSRHRYHDNPSSSVRMQRNPIWSLANGSVDAQAPRLEGSPAVWTGPKFLPQPNFISERFSWLAGTNQKIKSALSPHAKPPISSEKEAKHATPPTFPPTPLSNSTLLC